jgi:hypothetical protein
MHTQSHRYDETSPTGWVGWIYFAGFMMILAGAFEAIAGLTAIFKNTAYYVTANHLIALDYTQWGWIHLGLGALLILASIALFAGKMWGRVVGVALAALSAIANFAFIDAYPWWSLAVITVDILIIYSIMVHGRELEE